jgi:hypothetical protein
MKLSMKCGDGHVQSVEMDRNVPHLSGFTIQAVAWRECNLRQDNKSTYK